MGYDGSPESERALSAARDLASETGAAITVLWVVPLRDVPTARPAPSDWPGPIEDLIDRHAERLSGLRDVHGLIANGSPREELVKLGKDVDLLIVGSRDHGPIGRLVHGSVSRYLVGHATCPLLVLPRGAAVAAPPVEPEREVHLVAGSV